MKSLNHLADHLPTIVAYGDSAGLPYETKTREEIAALSDDVASLVPIDNAYMGQLPIGSWSDDTQLTLAVIDALVMDNGFDMDLIAKTHLAAYKESTKGWGGSTKSSVARIDQGISWEDAGAKDGRGNGILMKLAPLALLQAAHQDYTSNQQIIDFTRMTHDNPESIVASLVHRDILVGIINDTIDSTTILTAATTVANAYEKQFTIDNYLSKSLGRLASLQLVTPDDIAKLTPLNGFRADETLVMAYGSFARSPKAPKSIFDAVKLGGDTDSIASIVSTMSFFMTGEVDLPNDSTLLQDQQRLAYAGAAFAELIKTSR